MRCPSRERATLLGGLGLAAVLGSPVRAKAAQLSSQALRTARWVSGASRLPS
jgi:hypothetical protein